MILHNLKIAWRNLMKYKTQTLVSVVALAVGMVTLAATHFVLKHMGPPSIAAEPYYDRCHVMRFTKIQEAAKIDSIPTDDGRIAFGTSYNQVTPEMESALTAGGGLPGVEKTFYNSVVGYLTMGSNITFTMPDSTKRVFPSLYYMVQAETMNFHSIRSALTEEKIPVLNDKEVVISETVARTVFGDRNPIGCSITLWDNNWKGEFVIRDVYKAEKLFDNVTNAIYIHAKDHRENYIRELCLLLDEGFSPEEVCKEACRRLEPLGIKAEIESLEERNKEVLRTQLLARTIVYLISSLILVAALIGFLKMQLQLFEMRRREVSLRRVHGARGASIMGLFFCEMALVIILALGVALLLGNVLADYVSTNLAEYLDNFGWKIDGINESLLLIAAAVAAICAVVVRVKVQWLLRSRQAMAAQMHKNRRHTLRNSMLGLQLFISILFLGGTSALSHLIALFEEQKNVPHNDDFYARCIAVRPHDSYKDSQKLLEYLQTEAKGIAQYIAIGEQYNRIEELVGSEEAEEIFGMVTLFRILEVSDTAILGFWQRPIKWLLPPGERSNCILLSDSLYRNLDRLGLTASGMVNLQSVGAHRIGGTFSTLPYMDNNRASEFNMIVQIGSENRCKDLFVIVPEEGKYDRVFTDLENEMKRINPEVVRPTVSNLRENMTKELNLLQNMKRGAWILSAICFVICFMGIWSSISLDTRSRQKEVALRKVHGAKRKDIALLFGRLYLWLIAVASVLSVPLMLMFNTLLQDWGRQENVPSDLISPVTPILMSIGITSLVILVVVSLHVATVMRQKPADIIAKE